MKNALLNRHTGSIGSQMLLEDGSTNDENTLFFSPDILNQPIRSLSKCSPRRIRRRNSVELKNRCTPSQTRMRRTRAMMDFRVYRARMERRVEIRIQTHQPFVSLLAFISFL